MEITMPAPKKLKIPRGYKPLPKGTTRPGYSQWREEALRSAQVEIAKALKEKKKKLKIKNA